MQYITLNQLSAKLGGRSRSSIYRDWKARRLPAPVKFGSRLYWSEAAVDEAIAAQYAGEGA